MDVSGPEGKLLGDMATRRLPCIRARRLKVLISGVGGGGAKSFSLVKAGISFLWRMIEVCFFW